jgi:hypothetical protein
MMQKYTQKIIVGHLIGRLGILREYYYEAHTGAGGVTFMQPQEKNAATERN